MTHFPKILIAFLAIVMLRSEVRADPPPVIFVVSAECYEGAWVNNSQVQPPASFSGTYSTASWRGFLSVKQAPGTGVLSGYTYLDLNVDKGRATVRQDMGLRYQHNGGWPLFISNISTSASLAPYVAGPPGTPFQIFAKFFPGSGSLDYTAIGWSNPGWIFYHRFGPGEYAGSGVTSQDTIQFEGQIYSKTQIGVTTSGGLGYGNTGPGQAPFLFEAAGDITMEVIVDNLSKIPDLTCQIEGLENELPGISRMPSGYPESRTVFKTVKNYWAANLRARPLVRVRNDGERRAVPTTVKLQAHMADGRWVDLGTYDVPQLLPGEETTIRPLLNQTLKANAEGSPGDFKLLATVDPANSVFELDEYNNSSMEGFVIVDPRPQMTCLREVPNAQAGIDILQRLGFKKYFLGQDIGWGKPLTDRKIYSFYDGLPKPSFAFRIEGRVITWKNQHYLCFQGSERLGEPNPTEFALWLNPLYVANWHLDHGGGF